MEHKRRHSVNGHAFCFFLVLPQRLRAKQNSTTRRWAKGVVAARKTCESARTLQSATALWPHKRVCAVCCKEGPLYANNATTDAAGAAHGNGAGAGVLHSAGAAASWDAAALRASAASTSIAFICAS